MLTSKAAQSVYPERQFLRQINPLLKISLCLLLTSLALVLHDLRSLGVLVGVLLIVLLMAGRINLKLLGYGAIALFLFITLSTWLRDIHTAVISSLRLIAILLPTPLLSITTPPGDLVRALQTVRLPRFLVLSLMLIWRFVPLIQQEAQRILEANQLRGVDLTRQPTHWFAGLLMPLIFRIVAYADDVTVGLETRGYDPAAPRSIGQPLQWRHRDTLFFTGAIGLFALIGAMEWNGWHR
jgi:energy-coupling factor transport system permease protein